MCKISSETRDYPGGKQQKKSAISMQIKKFAPVLLTIKANKFHLINQVELEGLASKYATMNAHSLQTGQMHRGGIAMSSQPNANFWQTKESPIHDGQRFSNQQGGYNQQSQLQQRKGSHLQILQQQQQQQHDEQQDSQQRQQLQHARKQQLQLQLQEQLHLQRQRQQHQQHQQQQSVAVSPSQENSQNGPSPGFDIQRV